MKINKHGNYTYDNNGKVFYTREEVFDDMIINQKYNAKLQFCFHDELFEKVNWAIEPDVDIGTLYKMRAQQLRDKYNYLILGFSGGSDSVQVLYTFLKNNIFIDEIQTHHHAKAVERLGEDVVANDPDLQDFLEYKYAALPLLEMVRKLSPKTKITTLDCSDFSQVDYYNKKYLSVGGDSKLHPGTHRLYVGVPRMHGFFLTHYNNNIVEPPKNTAFIRGYEKPILSLDFNNNYELNFQFSDFVMRDSVRNVKGQVSDQYEIENFFWSQDAPLIPVKQSHLIKKVLESNEAFYNTFCYRQFDWMRHQIQNRKGYPKSFTTERIYSKIIYPDWNEGIYVAPKPTLTNPDFKIIHLLNNKKSFVTNVVSEIENHYKDKFKLIEDKKQFEQLIFTKRYAIGKVKQLWLEN
jgi:hypothetical protein